MLFAVTLVAILARSEKDALQGEPALLKSAIVVFFAALLQAFVLAQMAAPGDFMLDVNYLRNALVSPLLYFMYLRCRQDLATTRLLIIAVLAVAALAGLQAVRQGLDYGIGTYNETHRASGPFGPDYRDANRAGIYYAMFLPMFVGLALFMRKQRLWRLAAIAGIAPAGDGGPGHLFAAVVLHCDRRRGAAAAPAQHRARGRARRGAGVDVGPAAGKREPARGRDQAARHARRRGARREHRPAAGRSGPARSRCGPSIRSASA